VWRIELKDTRLSGTRCEREVELFDRHTRQWWFHAGAEELRLELVKLLHEIEVWRDEVATRFYEVVGKLECPTLVTHDVRDTDSR